MVLETSFRIVLDWSFSSHDRVYADLHLDVVLYLSANILLMEQKVTTQHSEIQKLLTENQQIAVTHVALRQELAAAQQEIQRMPSIILGLQK
uniref:Uncharacterized protein n=2 Tax=Physcomitrium patens TaxID=3218 RepID=A0A7I4F8Z4_PHYPA